MDLLYITLLCVAFSIPSYCAPFKEDDYWRLRNSLESFDSITGNSRSLYLNKDEVIVDRFLSYQRGVELQKNPTLLLLPIEDTLSHVVGTDIFKIFKTLPKGGNLHTHENHMLQRHLVLDIAWQCEDFEHLYILPETHAQRPWTVEFFLYPPKDEPWVKVKGHDYYTKDRILQHLTLINILNSMPESNRTSPIDSVKRWSDSMLLWSRLSKVIGHLHVKREYISQLVSQSLADGVQYMETRKSFSKKERLYVLDSDPKFKVTHGKHFLEESPGEEELRVVADILNSVGKEHPDFLGFRRLVQSVRHRERDVVLEDIHRAFDLHQKFPNIIAGFDLAGEEDTGLSGLYHLDGFLTVKNYMQNHSGFHLICHAGETSVSGRGAILGKPRDLEGAAGNLYHAVALNATRIGHGLGLVKEPALWSIAKTRPLPVEVCPVCNQILGYVPDYRNHPAIALFRSGVPIVLGSDAHGIFGFDYFTVDWVMAFLAWDLSLVDLKEIATNSLRYSLMPEEEKVAALAKWRKLWDHFIADVLALACPAGGDINQIETEPELLEVIPLTIQYSPDLNEGVDIDIYGRNFHVALCQGILCRFGDSVPHNARYQSMEHVRCRYKPYYTPQQCAREDCDGLPESPSTSNETLYLSFDGGISFVRTEFDISILVE